MSSVPTSFVTVDPVLAAFADIPEKPAPSLHMAETCPCGVTVDKWDKRDRNNWGSNHVMVNAQKFGRMLRYRLGKLSDPVLSPDRSPCPVSDVPSPTKSSVIQESHENMSMDVCFASAGTTGIVDLGASQTVVGSAQLREIIDGWIASDCEVQSASHCLQLSL